MKLTEEQIVERITDIIDTETNLELQDDGIYSGEIYVDYRDELDTHTVKKIFDSDTPRQTFYELFEESYYDAEWEYHKEVLDTIEKHFFNEYEDEDGDEKPDYLACEDCIRCWVDEHVYFEFPYEHFLNQDVRVDIMVDTGDENYDYTLNCVYSHYNGPPEDTIDNQAAIVWLAKQQGYTKTQLNRALKKNEYNGSKFLESMWDEVANCTTHMNALTFFVQMTLGELLDLNDALIENKKDDPKVKLKYSNDYQYVTVDQRKGRSKITLGKGVACGLYDCWSGGGSILEISLDKDVVLPMKYISSALPDGCRGYGVDEIYGMCSTFWRAVAST